MFSLIISIIAIALAAVLLLTSAFYGGDALTQGTSKAEAAALANEAQQISAAYDLFRVEHSGVAPTNIDGTDGDGVSLVGEEYLKAAPSGWTDDLTSVTSFVNSASGEVCQHIISADNGLECYADAAATVPTTEAEAEAALSTTFEVRFPF
jgi:hypothetical protein